MLSFALRFAVCLPQQSRSFMKPKVSSCSPLFETCFSVISFCPICYFYFYIFATFVMFPNFVEVAFCERYPMHPRNTLPSGHQSYVL